MLDNDFLEILSSLNSIKSRMESALNNYNREGYENNKIYGFIEDKVGDIESMASMIEYLNITAKIDTISENENGRFKCDTLDHYYTCGSIMEAYVSPSEDECRRWCYGRVEGEFIKGKGTYYFLNYDGDNVYLHDGMKVRVRRKYW